MKYEELMELSKINLHDPDFKRELFKALQRDGYGEITRYTINPEQFMMSFMEKMGVSPITIGLKRSELITNLLSSTSYYRVRFQIFDRRGIPDFFARIYQQLLPDWPLPLTHDLIAVQFTKKVPEIQMIESTDSKEIILSFSRLDFLPSRAELIWKDLYINKQDYRSSLSKVIEDTFVPIFGQ